MGEYRSILNLAVLILFLLGLLSIIVSLYDIFRNGIGAYSAVYQVTGFILLLLPVIFFIVNYSEYNKVILSGKPYFLESSDSKVPEVLDENVENLERALSVLDKIAEQAEIYENVISESYTADALQHSINIIDKQLAIREYQESTNKDEGLKVVKFDGERITAKSKEELNLTEGLQFYILSDETDDCQVTGRIGTAELIESESSTGKLFQFMINEWKSEKEEWKTKAKVDLEGGHARMGIINEDVVDVEKEELEKALQCLQKIKYSQGVKYEY